MIHLVKLCVGVDSVEDLAQWIEQRLAERRRQGEPERHTHRTRMMPKRIDELLAGGSLYWVIRGTIQCRQELLDIRSVTGADGIRRCELVLAPQLVLTEPRPRAAFQGWRYLPAHEAAPDIAEASGVAEMPAELRRELTSLGLL